MVKRKGRFKPKKGTRIITESTAAWHSKIASSKCFEHVAVFDPEINVDQQQPQFEWRERRLVSFMRSVKKNQPQPNADHSDIEANVGIDVNIDGYQGAQVNNRLTIVWYFEIALIKCIGHVGCCMPLGSSADDIKGFPKGT